MTAPGPGNASASLTWSVERTHRSTVVSQKMNSKLVPVELPPGKPVAEVKVSLSQTVNLGNFQSVRAEVSVMVPAPATADGIELTYERAARWAQEKVVSLLPPPPSPAGNHNPFGG